MTTTTVEHPDLLVGQQPDDTAKPQDADERYWSVTTILGCLDRPALIYWAAQQTAKAAIRDRDAWLAIREASGDIEAEKWLTGARFRKGKNELSDAAFGTALHELLETYALTGNRPTPDPEIFFADTDKAVKCLDQFDRWTQQFQPTYQAAEVAVYNRTYGYAGTCDGFFTVDGVRFIFDYKSTKEPFNAKGDPKPIYPETALQLAAYRYAELAAVWRPRRFERFRRRYYLLSQAEVDEGTAVPEVDGGLGIKISPEYCHAYPLACDEKVFEAFLFVQETARWSFEASKQAVGEILTPPAPYEDVSA